MKLFRFGYIFYAFVSNRSEDGLNRISSVLKATNSVKTEDKNPQAVVIGGGPVGLAAALTLAKAPHNYDVTVYESSDGEVSTRSYNVAKAYVYHVNQRGQTLTMQFPELQDRLEECGIPTGKTVSGKGYLAIPADANEILPNSNVHYSGVVVSNGEEDDYTLVTDKNGNVTKRKESGYWIPRHLMVVIMHEVLEEHNKARTNVPTTNHGKIQYIPGKKCISVRPSNNVEGNENKSKVEIILQNNENGESITHEAKLVIGADGMNSKVRECLATNINEFKNWPGYKNNRFKVKKWTTPATGLILKTLQFPPQFEIPVGDGTTMKSNAAMTYTIKPMRNGPFDFVQPGFFPMRNKNAMRPANIIGRPNHNLWKLKDGEGVRDFFEASFPRFPFHKGSNLIPESEWERFSKSKGTTFPPCQYSPGLQASSPDGNCGIVLLGDSAHAFSPDIGQGINAGLSDVVAFDRSLRGVDEITGKEKVKNNSDGSSMPKLGTALKKYERVRGPELKALTRLARFGSPYQYSQPMRKDRIGKKLWMLNVVFRLALNKISFGLIPPSCVVMSQKKELTFRQMMRRADATTFGIVMTFLWALSKIIKPFF